jgi:hypothetical protein
MRRFARAIADRGPLVFLLNGTLSLTGLRLGDTIALRGGARILRIASRPSADLRGLGARPAARMIWGTLRDLRWRVCIVCRRPRGGPKVSLQCPLLYRQSFYFPSTCLAPRLHDCVQGIVRGDRPLRVPWPAVVVPSRRKEIATPAVLVLLVAWLVPHVALREIRCGAGLVKARSARAAVAQLAGPAPCPVLHLQGCKSRSNNPSLKRPIGSAAPE